MTRRASRLVGPLLAVAALAGGCLRPRYAHYAVDRYAFSRATAQAGGFLVPDTDPPVSRLNDVPEGHRLVLRCMDFDRRISFEAIAAKEGGRFAVLALTAGRPAPATADQLAFLAPLLDVDVARLIPSGEAESYRARREELERTIAADPLAGLNLMASREEPLFISDAGELLLKAVRHARATAETLSAVVDVVSQVRNSGAGLRRWLAWGGGGHVVERLLQEPACSREVARRVAERALDGRLRGDRELLLLGVLRRPEPLAEDLGFLVEGLTKAAAPSSERRRVFVEIARHRNADDRVRSAVLRAVPEIQFSADRREVLTAVVEAAGSEPLLADAVAAACAQLDYDDDLEAVLTRVARHPRATEAVRSAVRAGAGAIRSPAARERVEAAAHP